MPVLGRRLARLTTLAAFALLLLVTEGGHEAVASGFGAANASMSESAEFAARPVFHSVRHGGSRGHALSERGPSPEFRIPWYQANDEEEEEHPLVPSTSLMESPLLSHPAAVVPGREDFNAMPVATERASFQQVLRRELFGERLPEYQLPVISTVAVTALQARAPPGV